MGREKSGRAPEGRERKRERERWRCPCGATSSRSPFHEWFRHPERGAVPEEVQRNAFVRPVGVLRRSRSKFEPKGAASWVPPRVLVSARPANFPQHSRHPRQDPLWLNVKVCSI